MEAGVKVCEAEPPPQLGGWGNSVQFQRTAEQSAVGGDGEGRLVFPSPSSVLDRKLVS